MSVSSTSKGIKRKHDLEAPDCRFGKDCYRLNTDHFQEFLHPKGSVHKSADECNELFRGKELHSKHAYKEMPLSFRENQYSFYFNKIEGIEDCFNENSLSMKDILSDRFGKLVKSIQFNYLIDIPWLMSQYPPCHRSKPLLIIHGFKDAQKISLQEEAAEFESIKLCQADLSIPFGTHHTKMMIHLCEEGLRIIITTANLIENDWTKKTQSIWVSPMFPKLSSDSKRLGNMALTNFGKDLAGYLSAYKKDKVDDWVRILNDHDLSEARVHLVASVPGRFSTKEHVGFGHLKLKQLLEKECDGPGLNSSWPVICQTSSIGSLGSRPDDWLTGEFLNSLSARTGGRAGATSLNLKIVYPSVENIRGSLEGYMAGGSFPYSRKVASKQTYLKDFMLRWKFDTRGRDRAMPHLKSYFRPSPCVNGGLEWYLMTSANVSKAAWGCLEKNKTQLLIRSYEIGVLFVPRCFNDLGTSKDVLNDFPTSLDLPVTPYSKDDEPWIYDTSYTKVADTHGRIWKMD